MKVRRRKPRKQASRFKFQLSAAAKRNLKHGLAAVQISAVVLFLVLVLIPDSSKSKQAPSPAEPATLSKPLPAPPPAVKPQIKKAPVIPKPRRRTDGPKISIVIDDIGHNREHEEALKALGPDVTYAVLPRLRYSGHFGKLGKKMGAEVILHLPLETLDGTVPGPGLITNRMPPDYVRDQLRRDLESVPYRQGVNNHMGSYGSAQKDLMRIILADLKARGLFYLDSQTTPESVAPEIGAAMGLPVLKRDVFLDNVDEESAIRAEIQTLKSVARRRGYAIGIGHYRAATLKVLAEMIPELKKEGFEFVTLEGVIETDTEHKLQGTKKSDV